MLTGNDAVQISMFDHDSWFGKTSPEHSAPTKGKTSRQSSKKQSGSPARKPQLCMCLGGGWPASGLLYDRMGRWSVAWRVHDAQFWGVPQRRKRIALVADFGGLCAGEVLFERKGLRWYPPTGGETGEGTAGEAAGSADQAISFQERSGKDGGGKGILIQEEKSAALRANYVQSVCRFGEDRETYLINDKATRFQGGGPTRHGDGAGNGLGIGKPGDPSPTLSTSDRHGVMIIEPRSQDGTPRIGYDISPTLNTAGGAADPVRDFGGGEHGT